MQIVFNVDQIVSNQWHHYSQLLHKILGSLWCLHKADLPSGQGEAVKLHLPKKGDNIALPHNSIVKHHLTQAQGLVPLNSGPLWHLTMVAFSGTDVTGVI